MLRNEVDEHLRETQRSLGRQKHRICKLKQVIEKPKIVNSSTHGFLEYEKFPTEKCMSRMLMGNLKGKFVILSNRLKTK